VAARRRLRGPYSGKLADVQTNDNAAFLPKTAESTEVNDLQRRFADQDTTPGIIVLERESGITAADRALATQQLAEVRTVRSLARSRR
jgi:RND superfamily putative drug exporter